MGVVDKEGNPELVSSEITRIDVDESTTALPHGDEENKREEPGSGVDVFFETIEGDEIDGTGV